jgi:hypothetical protein
MTMNILFFRFVCRTGHPCFIRCTHFFVFNKFPRQKHKYCCSVNVREALISVVNEYVILEILINNGAVSQIKGESKVIC